MNIIFGTGYIWNPVVKTDPNLLNIQNSLAPTCIFFANKFCIQMFGPFIVFHTFITVPF